MLIDKVKFNLLSVIIPVYNESGTIKECVQRVLKADICGMNLEIIISDNLSTDGSRKIIENFNDPRIKIVLREKHSGKGANVRSALEIATGDIVITQDADLEYNPLDYPEVLKPFFEAEADVVYGSRLTWAKYHRVFGILHLYANKTLTWVANILFDTIFTDIETATKAFRMEVIKGLNLVSEGFEIETEITAKVMKDKTLKVFEVPITHVARTYDEGKKVKWWHFFTSLWSLIKWRFKS